MTISSEDWSEIWSREHLLDQGMIMLADPDQVITEAYGLKDTTLGEEVARPASFLVGRDGTIQWRFLHEDWRVRTSGPAYVDVVRDHRQRSAP